jgi:hypothetical protein
MDCRQLREKPVAQANSRVYRKCEPVTCISSLFAIQGKGVIQMEWTTPDFEEYETMAEMTAYAGHWPEDEDNEAEE